MEDGGAEFVTMLMDRLQVLEGQVQQLGTDNVRLKAEMDIYKEHTRQLKGALCLKDDKVHFSDGWMLAPGFAEREDQMLGEHGMMALDDLHLDAIAHRGAMLIHVDNLKEQVPMDDLIGVIGGDFLNDPVTVRQLLAAINAWCTRVRDGTTNIQRYMAGVCGVNLMEMKSTTSFDPDSGCASFEMILMWDEHREG